MFCYYCFVLSFVCVCLPVLLSLYIRSFSLSFLSLLFLLERKKEGSGGGGGGGGEGVLPRRRNLSLAAFGVSLLLF